MGRDLPIPPRGRLDALLRELRIDLVLATARETQLDTTACAVTNDARCVRCELAADLAQPAALLAAVSAAPPTFVTEAGLRRIVICSRLVYLGDHGADPGGTIDLARGALFVASDTLAGRAAAVFQHELFHLFDARNPLRDEDWLELNPRGFRYGVARPSHAGFARPYGMTDAREDKATVYEAIILREVCAKRDPIVLAKARLLRARIAGAIGGDVTFLDDLEPCLIAGP